MLIKNNSRYLIFTLTILISFTFKINTQAFQSNKTFQDGVIYISQFIVENNFSENNLNDYEMVDSIYTLAVDFYEGDISEALLALTFATLPFNRMVIKIPIFNLKVPLRLPSVSESIFKLKKNNLPGIIYFDSPKQNGQDKDKVAHFFGNAFLSYNVSLFNLSKFLGFFVELFEASFNVSAGIDFRDLQTNILGEYFGKSLHKNNSLMPSDFFNVYSLFFFSYN